MKRLERSRLESSTERTDHSRFARVPRDLEQGYSGIDTSWLRFQFQFQFRRSLTRRLRCTVGDWFDKPFRRQTLRVKFVQLYFTLDR